MPSSVRDSRSSSIRSQDVAPLDPQFEAIIGTGLTFERYLSQAKFTDAQRQFFTARKNNARPLTVTEFINIHLPQAHTDHQVLTDLATTYDDQQIANRTNKRDKARALKRLLTEKQINKNHRQRFYTQLRALETHQQWYEIANAEFEETRKIFEETKAAFLTSGPVSGLGTIAENISFTQASLQNLIIAVRNNDKSFQIDDKINQLAKEFRRWPSRLLTQETVTNEQIDSFYQGKLTYLIKQYHLPIATQDSFVRLMFAQSYAVKMLALHQQSETPLLTSHSQTALNQYLHGEVSIFELLQTVNGSIEDASMRTLFISLLSALCKHASWHIISTHGVEKYTLSTAPISEINTIINAPSPQSLNKHLSSDLALIDGKLSCAAYLQKLVACKTQRQAALHQLNTLALTLTSPNGLRRLPTAEEIRRLLNFSACKKVTSAGENVATKLQSLRDHPHEIDRLHSQRLAAVWDNLSIKLQATYSLKEEDKLTQQRRLFKSHLLMLQHIEQYSNQQNTPNWLPPYQLAAIKLYHNLLVFEAKHEQKNWLSRFFNRHELKKAQQLRQVTQSFLTGNGSIHTLAAKIERHQRSSRPSLLARLFNKKSLIHHEILAPSRVESLITKAHNSQQPATARTPLFVDHLDQWFPEINPNTARRSFRARQLPNWETHKFTLGDISILKTRRVPPLSLIKAGIYTHLINKSHPCLEAYMDYLARHLCLSISSAQAHEIFEKHSKALSDTGIRFNHHTTTKRIIGLAEALDAGLLAKLTASSSETERDVFDTNRSIFHLLDFIKFDNEDILALESQATSLSLLVDSGLLPYIQHHRLISHDKEKYKSLLRVTKHALALQCKTGNHSGLQAAKNSIAILEQISATNRLSTSLVITYNDLVADNGIANEWLNGALLSHDTLSYLAWMPTDISQSDIINKLGRAGVFTHQLLRAMQLPSNDKIKELTTTYQSYLARFSQQTNITPAEFEACIAPLLRDGMPREATHVAKDLTKIYWKARLDKITSLEALNQITNDLERFTAPDPAKCELHAAISQTYNYVFSGLDLQGNNYEKLKQLHALKARLQPSPTLNEQNTSSLNQLREAYLLRLLANNEPNQFYPGHSVHLERHTQILHPALDINISTLKSFIKNYLTNMLTAESIDFATLQKHLDLFVNNQIMMLPAQAFTLKRLHPNATYQDHLTQAGEMLLLQFIDNKQFELLDVLGGNELLTLYLEIQLKDHPEKIINILMRILDVHDATYQNRLLNNILSKIDVLILIDTALKQDKHKLVNQLLSKLDNRELTKVLKFSDNRVLPLTRTTLKRDVITASLAHLNHIASQLNTKAPAYVDFVLSQLRHRILPTPATMRLKDKTHTVDPYGIMVKNTIERLAPADQINTTVQNEIDQFSELLNIYLTDDDAEPANPYRALTTIDEHLASPRWFAMRLVDPDNARRQEKTILPVIEQLLADAKVYTDLDLSTQSYQQLANTLRTLHHINAVLLRNKPELAQEINSTLTSLSATKKLFTAVVDRFSAYKQQPHIAQSAVLNTELNSLLDQFETNAVRFYLPGINRETPSQNSQALFDTINNAINTKPDDALFTHVRNILETTPNLPAVRASLANSNASRDSATRPTRADSSPTFFATIADMDNDKIGIARERLCHIQLAVEKYAQFTLTGCNLDSRFDHADAKHFLDYSSDANDIMPSYAAAITHDPTLAVARDAAQLAGVLGSTHALSSNKKFKFKEALNLVRNIKLLDENLQSRSVSVKGALQQIITLLVLHQAYIPRSQKLGYVELIHKQINTLTRFAADNQIQLKLSQHDFSELIQPILDKATPSELEAPDTKLRQPHISLADAKKSIQKMLVAETVQLAHSASLFQRHGKYAENPERHTAHASTTSA